MLKKNLRFKMHHLLKVWQLRTTGRSIGYEYPHGLLVKGYMSHPLVSEVKAARAARAGRR